VFDEYQQTLHPSMRFKALLRNHSPACAGGYFRALSGVDEIGATERNEIAHETEINPT
jgi:hypothetical protein